MTPFAPAHGAVPDAHGTDRAHLQALENRIAELSAHLDAATHRLLRMVAEFDRLEGWASGGFRSCAEWLSWRTGMAPGAARERVRVARALEALPQVSAALARGELSYSKARAITRVARPETEARLLTFAMHATAAQTERLVAGWASIDRATTRDDAEARKAEAIRHASRFVQVFPDPMDGSWILKGRLDPEVGMLLRKALELGAEALFRSEAEDPSTPFSARWADALGLLAEAALRAGVEVDRADPAVAEEGAVQEEGAVREEAELKQEAGVSVEFPCAARGSPSEDPRMQPRVGRRIRGRADRFQVILHVSAETSPSVDSGGAQGTCACADPITAAPRSDWPLPPATRDRLACDASRVVIHETADGTPLSVGRRSRIVPPPLRRALERRDGGCRFPGCGNLLCDAHHVIPWQDGGPTDLGNLVLLCRRHHRLVHEGGFRAELPSEAGPVRFFDPDGREIVAAPPRPRLGGDVEGGFRDRVQADGLVIDASTNFPKWDGARLDLGLALSVLWEPPHDEPDPP